jgi:hypothetical protein
LDAPSVGLTMVSNELRLHGQARGTIGVGDRVVAYLRPEDIHVIDEGALPALPNVVDADVERVIFEGPTVQLRVRVGDRPLRVDVGGGRRLTLADGVRRVRLEFGDLTVIAAPAAAGASDPSEVAEPEPLAS